MFFLIRTDRDGSVFVREYAVTGLGQLGEDVKARADTTGVARLEIVIPTG